MKVRNTSRLRSEPLRIGRSFAVYVPIEVELSDLGEELPNVERILLTIDHVPNVGIRTTEITATAKAGGEITGTELRDIKVANFTKQAIAHVLVDIVDNPDGSVTVTPGERAKVAFGDDEQAAIRAAGPTPENLKIVADIYSFAEATGFPPARQVELQLGLPRTTASKWVRRAREAGYLDG